MAIAYAGNATGTSSSNSTTAAVNLSGASVGDLALVAIIRSNNTNPSTVPSGWTLVDSVIYSPYVYKLWLYRKTLASGDLTTHTWEWAAGVATLCNAVRYSGVDSSSPIDDYATWASAASSRIHYFGSLTSDQPWLVGITACYYTQAITYSPSSGYTERLDTGSMTPDLWNSFHDTNGGWGGGTSNAYASLNKSVSRGYSFHLALTPAASGTTYYQTASVAASVASSALRRSRITRSVASSSATSLLKRARVTRAASGVVSVSVLKRTMKACSVTVAAVVAAVAQRVGATYQIALSAASSTVAAVSKRARVTRAVASSAATGIRRTTRKALSVAGASVASVTKLTRRALAASGSGTASVLRATSKALAVAGAASVSVLKRTMKACSVTVAAVVSAIAHKVTSGTYQIALSVSSSVSVSISRTTSKALSAASSTVAAVSKRIATVRAVTAVAVVSIMKRTLKSLEQTAVAEAAVAKRIRKELAASGSSSPAIAAIKLTGVVYHVTASAVASAVASIKRTTFWTRLVHRVIGEARKRDASRGTMSASETPAGRLEADTVGGAMIGSDSDGGQLDATEQISGAMTTPGEESS